MKLSEQPDYMFLPNNRSTYRGMASGQLTPPNKDRETPAQFHYSILDESPRPEENIGRYVITDTLIIIH